MPRFMVILFDPVTAEVQHSIRRTDDPVTAICSHVWLTTIYQPQWVVNNIQAEDVADTLFNLKEAVGWLGSCLNLDDELMRELNGDSCDETGVPQ